MSATSGRNERIEVAPTGLKSALALRRRSYQSVADYPDFRRSPAVVVVDVPDPQPAALGGISALHPLDFAKALIAPTGELVPGRTGCSRELRRHVQPSSIKVTGAGRGEGEFISKILVPRAWPVPALDQRLLSRCCSRRCPHRRRYFALRSAPSAST